MIWIKRICLLALCLVFLSACGGGGSGGGDVGGGDVGGEDVGGEDDDGEDPVTAAPPAPAATLTPTATKTFAFSWSDVSEETEYRLLENPDGDSGYNEVAVIPADSTEHNLTVSLPQRVNASYILQACNSLGCTDSDEMFVTGSLAEAVGYFKASNTEADDLFGFQVALSADGRVMAVAAAQESSGATGSNGDQADNSVEYSGAVYVFTQNNGVWTQQAYLKASNPGHWDFFGISLSLSADGGVLAVGASGEGSNAFNSGAVYVFTQSAGVWSQQAHIKASNTQQSDEFGGSLALSADGSTLAVGAYAEDSSATGIDGNQADNSASASGAVYVFTQSGDTWSQQAYIKASNTEESDYFGHRVALSSNGNVLAVSANNEDSVATGIDGNQADNSATNSGAVYVFSRNDGTWSQQAYIKASNPEENDWFGSSLALSSDGHVLAVGATGEDSAATGIDGNQADNSVDFAGAVYVFTQSGDTWSQQAYIKASNTAEFDRFGASLALSADSRVLAVGTDAEDSSATGINGDEADDSANSSGAVYQFSQNAGTWSQQAYVKAPNTEGGDLFGRSGIALSSDGSVLAVGAWDESSSATGINGDQADNSAEGSGAVYLY
ncbi:FG-GAP repeat protein [Microbulbifer sp.]|uniref:FG-GAP repeat protein n=1 Tax=Microbulbifer sp. TaxID=1908541 RepID=UPI003F3F6A79